MEREPTTLPRIEEFLKLQKNQKIRPLVVEGRFFANAELRPLFYVARFPVDANLEELKFNSVSFDTRVDFNDWYRHILELSPYKMVDYDRPVVNKEMKDEIAFSIKNGLPIYVLTFGITYSGDQERTVVLLNMIKGASPKQAIEDFEKCASIRLFGKVLTGI